MLGERIKKVRKLRNITQKTMSHDLDISPSYLCDVENGRANLSVTTLLKCATLLQTTVSYLVGESDDIQVISKEMTNVVSELSCNQFGKELLLRLSDINHWSENDRIELLHYLNAKQSMRNNSID